MIKEKALFFAHTCGCPEGKEKVLTRSWLEKFKQRNNLLGAKVRKGSNGTRNGIRSGSSSPSRINTDSAGESSIHSSNGRSSRSSTHESGSPVSPTQSQEELKREEGDGLPELAGGFHSHSKSAPTLETTGMTSPTSTLVSESPFTPTSQARLPLPGINTNRPRSQTFPQGLPIDPSLLAADEAMTQCTRTESQQSSSVAVLESPVEMEDVESSAEMKDIDPTMMRRNRSNPEIKTTSMQPPPSVSKSSTVSPVMTPGSPTQDEARQALELVMSYFQAQPAGLAAQEYFTIGKLMERLELAKNHQNALLGGLPRIEEHDDIPRVSKKRSIHNLG